MSRIIPPFLFASLWLLPLSGSAQAGWFSGQWVPITSSSGPCKGCIIGIVHHGGIVTITTSEGWAAVLEASQSGRSTSAVGKGLRNGQPRFEIYLKLQNGRIYLARTFLPDGNPELVETMVLELRESNDPFVIP